MDTGCLAAYTQSDSIVAALNKAMQVNHSSMIKRCYQFVESKFSINQSYLLNCPLFNPLSHLRRILCLNYIPLL